MVKRERIKKGLRQDVTRPHPRHFGEEGHFLTAPAEDCSSRHLLDSEELLSGPHHGVRHTVAVCEHSFPQRDLPQKGTARGLQRSIVSLCGDLHHDPVVLRDIDFSYELCEEDPGVQTQNQRQLETKDPFMFNPGN